MGSPDLRSGTLDLVFWRSPCLPAVTWSKRASAIRRCGRSRMSSARPACSCLPRSPRSALGGERHLAHFPQDADSDVAPPPFAQQIELRATDGEIGQTQPVQRLRQTRLTEDHAATDAIDFETED